jgi:hypothetical protein
MSPSRIPPTRTALLVLPALGILLVLLALNLGPTSIASVPAASTTAAGGSPAPPGSPAGTALRSADPNASPSHPAPIPCEPPPAELPPAAAPVATPAVEADDMAILFTSHLYSHSVDGSLAAMDHEAGEWEVGLWHVAAGTNEVRLLLAPTGGMVLPLAMSTDGVQAVVWWLPRRTSADEPACTGGIYLISTSEGSSELIVSGDWSLTPEESQDPNIVATWHDLSMESYIRRDYLLPEVAFSSNGRYISLVEGTDITIYGRDPVHQRHQHTGECGAWAWSPTGAVFVAGCEDMTSAWLVHVGGGYQPESIPLPAPEHPDLPRDWEVASVAAIGLTHDRQIRVARFYGFPTGCMTADCTIPDPAWAVTTLDPASRAMVVAHAKDDFMVEPDLVGWDTRLSPDASWIYAEEYAPRRARAIDILTRDVHLVRRVLGPAGTAVEGSLLFGRRLEEDRRRVVVTALDRNGMSRDVATIELPDGAVADNRVILTAGLVITVPSR